jgi:prolyl 4-hydroxylase
MLARPSAEIDAVGAVALLSSAVAKGGMAAARQLAVLKALGLGTAEDWKGAVALVEGAARSGHPGALRELAMLGLLSGAPDSAALPMLRTAVQKGDASATALEARLGGAFAAVAAASNRAAEFAAPPPLDLRHISMCAEAALAPPRLLPRRKMLHERAPSIERLDGLLPRIFCDYLALLSEPTLTPSAVVDTANSRASHAEFRTSDGCLVGIVDLDLALFAIHRALLQACGVAVSNSELMGILRYRPGQEYRPHFDFLPPDAGDYSEVQRTGQRVATLLVVLDDAFEGGATIFPKLGIEWRGKAGDGLFFRNTDESERPYPLSLHAGAPVTSGEKRMLTLWLRARRFWFWE